MNEGWEFLRKLDVKWKIHMGSLSRAFFGASWRISASPTTFRGKTTNQGLGRQLHNHWHQDTERTIYFPSPITFFASATSAILRTESPLKSRPNS
jgi:hypothetical protein